MFEDLKTLICNYVEAEESEIQLTSRFAEDLGFNSYDFMCMLGDAEDEFDIEINEKEAAGMKMQLRKCSAKNLKLFFQAEPISVRK